MSAMVARSKVADSRSPSSAMSWPETCGGACAGLPCGTEVMVMVLSLSVRRRVVDVEVVEVPGRAVATELGGVLGPSCGRQQAPQFREVFCVHRLLDTVGAERGHRAPDVEARFVDGVAQGVARVAADHQSTGLCHECGHVADVP